MNQILAVENRKKEKNKRTSNGQTVAVKNIVIFFAVCMIIFGIVLAGEGSYAMYKEIEDKNPLNFPTVTIERENDKAIVNINNNIEISKIIYSWDDGEQTTVPIGTNDAQEEITLLGYDSTLNITVEDINRKRVKYKKEFLLDGQDITKPSIDIDTENGNDKMIITAIDETEILYLSYQWDGEEPVTIDVKEQGQKQISAEVPLTVGTKKINIIAEDKNGNIEKKEKEIVISTSKPKAKVIVSKKDKSKIKIQVTDKDGIKEVKANLNGKEYSMTDIDKKEGVNNKDIKLGLLTLRNGNNTISITVTNISGYTETFTGELQYNP